MKPYKKPEARMIPGSSEWSNEGLDKLTDEELAAYIEKDRQKKEKEAASEREKRIHTI